MRLTMKVGRTSLIDGDVLCYTAAAGASSRGEDSSELCERVVNEVRWWSGRAFCESILVAFSCKRPDNYRRDFWPSYKSHRDGNEAPEGLGDAIRAVRDEFPCITQPRIEADDLLGILGSQGTLFPDGSIPVMVTRDKDLRQVPGWHFNPDKDDFPVWVSESVADRFFYQQWMTGDPTDNVPGLFRVGPAAAGKLLDATPREGWDEAVLARYASHPKGYPPDYALAQARSVRILRAGEWDKATKLPKLWTPKSPNLTPELGAGALPE